MIIEDTIYKTMITFNIMFLFISIVLISILEKNSAEYVISVLALIINSFMLTYVILRLKKNKKVKS